MLVPREYSTIRIITVADDGEFFYFFIFEKCIDSFGNTYGLENIYIDNFLLNQIIFDLLSNAKIQFPSIST